MSITTAQSSVTADGANPTATLGSAPTEGNLLILIAVDRSGVSHADMTPPAGWTKRIGRDYDLDSPTYRRSMAVWSKVAGASESSSAQVTGGTFRLVLSEYEDSEGGTWAFEQKADNDNGATSDATSIGTGTTASVSDGNLLVIAVGYWKKGILHPYAAGYMDFDNSITNEENFDVTADYSRGLCTGYKTTSTGGTFTATGTYSNTSGPANAGLMAGILVFDAEAAVTTVAPTTLAPTTVSPTTIAPTTLAPTTLPPTTLPPTTLAPTTLAPTTLAPTTLAPTTLAPTSLAPTTLASTTLAPTTLAPTTLAPTTLAPTTLAPTTVAPTTLPPTTLAPTTLPATTLPPTTLPSTTLAPTTLPPLEGTVCWGHDTGVVEDNIRDFVGNWTGTGAITGSGDAEQAELQTGEYLESEDWDLGPCLFNSARIRQNVYQLGDDVTIKYKTAATQGALAGVGWSAYVPFQSLGWVKIRIEK